MSENPTDTDMLKYREEHFKVTVKLADHPVQDGEMILSITHNGYQWQSMTLLQSEAGAVVQALTDFKP